MILQCTQMCIWPPFISYLHCFRGSKSLWNASQELCPPPARLTRETEEDRESENTDLAAELELEQPFGYQRKGRLYPPSRSGK